jgi:hypothetical protein
MKAFSSSFPQHAVAALAHRSQNLKLILDPDAFIDPHAFVHLWESLPTTAEFSCNVFLIDARKRTLERGKGALVQHLQRGGFNIVAAGVHSEDKIKVYAFACGYDPPQGSDQLSSTNVKPTLCLIEIVIDTSSQTSDSSASEGHWVFDCHCKSTEEKKSAFFIGELNLGDLFMLT